MYWDVVEVKPEPGYCLFVRFKDGLSGHVRLREEDLTGVLAALRNTELFEQVFIEDGAVAWPGDIDLRLTPCMRTSRRMRYRLRVGETTASGKHGAPARPYCHARHLDARLVAAP